MGAVRLRNVGEAVHLYAPPGAPTSLPVDAGQIITVVGPLKEADDAYVLGEGDTARAYPKSSWALVEEPSRSTKKIAAARASEPIQEGGDS
ncbi:hypothetical protein [Streptomyces murinus]